MDRRWQVRLCDWQGYDLGVTERFWFRSSAERFLNRFNRLSTKLRYQYVAYGWDERRLKEFP